MKTSLNNLAYSPEIEKVDFKLPTSVNDTPIIEGVTEYDTLCPISKVTGHRGNPLLLLRLGVSDKTARLLDAVLQEIPSVQDMNASDEDKLAMCVQRLSSGTLAENDLITKELSNYVDVLFPNNPEVKEQVKETINFDSKDDAEVIDKV